jgi:hypothetical protein
MTNTIEPPKTPEVLEYSPDAWKGFTGSLPKQLRDSLSDIAEDQKLISGGCPRTDDCTYETDETYEIDEAKEAKESEETEASEEREELARLGPKLFLRIDEAISECRVSGNRDTNRPLFILAHKLRSTEEELNVRCSVDVIAQTLRRWQEQNHDHLKEDHDYLAEFLDKLSLVRFPRGRALLQAVEVARKVAPPPQTALFSPDFQLLATLCSVLQHQAGEKPFFLDGRAAAKALGRPHETVASWLRALCRLGVIRLISKGKRGVASRYEYIEQRAANARSRRSVK